MHSDDDFKESAIQMSEEADFSVEAAEELIREANARLGIGPKTYVKHRFYDLPLEEQADSYTQILERAKRNKERKKKLKARAKKVASMCALSEEEAQEDLERARKMLGVTYGEYVRLRFFEKTWEEQQNSQAELEADRANQAKLAEDALIESCVTMARKTGLSINECEALITEAHERLGIGPRTYVRHDFYEIPLDEQEAAYAYTLKQARKRERNR